MVPLIDMMLHSLDGDGYTQIQKQFGLDANEAEKALESVLPAFSTSLKRNTTQPKEFGAFMQALSDGGHEKYIDDTASAFSDEGMREGNGILKHLFGSKDTSRAVAAQASNASGVSEDIIKQMLPVVASMVMGGLFKQSTGQIQRADNGRDIASTATSNFNASSAGNGGILGQILGELIKGGIGKQNKGGQTRGRQQADNPLGDILEQMMGRSNRPTSRPADDGFGDDNPLGEIFKEALGKKRGEYQPPRQTDTKRSRKRPERENEDQYNEDQNNEIDGGFEDIGSAEQYDRPEPSRRRRPTTAPRRKTPQKRGGGLEDLFGDMFETGRDVDEGYQKGIESIFDKFMKG